MRYTDFLRIYEGAKTYTDFDMYVAERGWQDWMNSLSDEKIIKYLTTIYSLAKGDNRERRETLCSSRSKMSQLFHIPVRTLEAWETSNESGAREMRSYLEAFYAFAIFTEMIEERENDSTEQD